MALENGLFELPESGRVGLFRPSTNLDLQLFSGVELHVIHGFAPDVAHFQAMGVSVSPKPEGPYSASFVFLPRSKLQARDLIAQAVRLTKGGPVVVDGAKTDGVDSILRALKKAGAQIGEVIAKSHGKIYVIHKAELNDWEADEIILPDGQQTRAGVFSADAVDRASELLGTYIGGLSGKIADLGAGWGYLSGEVLKSGAVTECHLVEAEFDALMAAKSNVHDTRAVFHWADVARFDEIAGMDHIVCNPPFHTGRKADPTLGRAFIQATARLLAPRGTVWLVANRHLPYETTLQDLFSEVVELGDNKSFKIFRASKPRRNKA